MSNREALRKLSRKFPAPPEIERIMNDLSGEKDISVALVATSIAEASLEKLIVQKFKSKNTNLIGQIFLNGGPLSDFHSKILIAHAFQIITSNLAEEMHSLKAIRNVFAHAKVPVTFDHELIAKEIHSLKMLTAIKSVEHETARKIELSNKAWFLLTTKLVLIMFAAIGEHPGTADECLREVLGKDPTKKLSSSP